jgi:hypothetical protein
MGGAVVVGTFELQHDLAVVMAFESLVGDGGPGDVPTEVFELVALVDGEPHLGMRAQSPAH